MLLAPQVEEATITKSYVLGGIDAEADGSLVDPFGGAFEFSVVADGGFIHHAMPGAIGPFGTQLFIAEGG